MYVCERSVGPLPAKLVVDEKNLEVEDEIGRRCPRHQYELSAEIYTCSVLAVINTQLAFRPLENSCPLKFHGYWSGLS